MIETNNIHLDVIDRLEQIMAQNISVRYNMNSVLNILNATFAKFFGENFVDQPSFIDMNTLLALSLSSLNGSSIATELDQELMKLINRDQQVARAVYSLHQTSNQQARFWSRIQPSKIKKMLNITSSLLPTDEHELHVYLIMMSQVQNKTALLIYLMLDMSAINQGPAYRWLDQNTHIFDGVNATIQHAIRNNLKCEMINNYRPAPQQPVTSQCIFLHDSGWEMHWDTLTNHRGFLVRIIGFPLTKWLAGRICLEALIGTIVHQDCLIQKSFCLAMNQVPFGLIATIINCQTTPTDRAKFWQLISRCPDKNLDKFIHNCLRHSNYLDPQNLRDVECYLQALARAKQNEWGSISIWIAFPHLNQRDLTYLRQEYPVWLINQISR